MPALLSAVVDRTGDGLRDGELVAVVTIGVVEMTDAVFVAPPVVPLRKKKLTLSSVVKCD